MGGGEEAEVAEPEPPAQSDPTGRWTRVCSLTLLPHLFIPQSDARIGIQLSTTRAIKARPQ